MFRLFALALLLSLIAAGGVLTQPGIKGRRIDTTQSIFQNDSVMQKLAAFKDSMAKVGPMRETVPDENVPTGSWLALLLVGVVVFIFWVGRRAWLKNVRNKSAR